MNNFDSSEYKKYILNFFLTIRCTGKLIKKRRLELNMTQEDLAEKTEFATNYIARIENSDKPISKKALTKICYVLDMSKNLFAEFFKAPDILDMSYCLKNKFEKLSKRKQIIILKTFPFFEEFLDSFIEKNE